ncbi:MAG: hypothetical protein KGJ45_11570 [Elusimicrobia bacterium]|nr:hypothetical protein [Elusimicrobiota bacterium]
MKRSILAAIAAVILFLAAPAGAQTVQHAFGPSLVSGTNSSPITLVANTLTTIVSVNVVYNPRAQGTEAVACWGFVEIDTGASASVSTISTTLGGSQNNSVVASSKESIQIEAAGSLTQASSPLSVSLQAKDTQADTIPTSGGFLVCAGFPE